ncbi:hypothetical protein PIB30_067625 [Stylosanthes scabra]|uniref:Uncharacterized protein n=1 Tax=Stylosanthes scabra TaxID=79078 RepID=A0ABU6URC2_9FABA|nr:hypothetical protein [Stylosanthes scabra]
MAAPSLHSLHRLHPPRPPLSHRRCHHRPPPRRRPSHHWCCHHCRCLLPSSPECNALPKAAVLATTDLLQGAVVFALATNPSPPFALSFLLPRFSPFLKPRRGIVVAARRRGSCAVLLVVLCAAHHPLHCRLCIPSLQQRSSQELEHVELDDEEENDEPVFVLTDEWREFFPKSEARRKQGIMYTYSQISSELVTVKKLSKSFRSAYCFLLWICLQQFLCQNPQDLVKSDVTKIEEVEWKVYD